PSQSVYHMLCCVPVSFSWAILPVLLSLFPSTTLFRSLDAVERAGVWDRTAFFLVADHGMEDSNPEVTGDWGPALRATGIPHRDEDRKSTRLNSSHVKISYAVFCLKKKNTNKFSKVTQS